MEVAVSKIRRAFSISDCAMRNDADGARNFRMLSAFIRITSEVPIV